MYNIKLSVLNGNMCLYDYTTHSCLRNVYVSMVKCVYRVFVVIVSCAVIVNGCMLN